MKRVRREDLIDWATYSDRRSSLRARAMAEHARVEAELADDDGQRRHFPAQALEAFVGVS